MSHNFPDSEGSRKLSSKLGGTDGTPNVVHVRSMRRSKGCMQDAVCHYSRCKLVLYNT